MTKQEKAIQASIEAKIAWARACRYDGIQPSNNFACFSPENPYAQAAGNAAIKALRLWASL